MMGPSPGVFRAVSRDFVVFVVVCLFVCFLATPQACGILVLQEGIEHAALGLEAWEF